jgi:histidine phosphotransferase ChpT
MAHNAIHNAGRFAEQTGNSIPNLTAMVVSRICHDLVSPLGAIGNGVELMQLSPHVQGPELSLVAESTENANARLRYYRIAFGAVSSGQSISNSEILSILAALQPHQKHEINWSCEPGLTRKQVKLVFLLLLCLESTIPWGGEIKVSTTPTGVQLIARSQRMRIEDNLWEALGNGGAIDELTSAKIHFAVAGAEIAVQGCHVSFSERNTSLHIDVALQ